MNTKKIEILAISKLNDLLANMDYLIPEISENDRSPSWDGFVYLYNKKDSDKKKISIKEFLFK